MKEAYYDECLFRLEHQSDERKESGKNIVGPNTIEVVVGFVLSQVRLHGDHFCHILVNFDQNSSCPI